jgi:hypothetical protein
MPDVYVRLDREEFRALVRGEELVLHAHSATGAAEVHIILADIGWEQMKLAIEDAQHAA